MPGKSVKLSVDDLRRLIRDIPDFPSAGILFRDITPLLANSDAFHQAITLMAAPYRDIDHVVCIESRGFILGAPIAFKLDAGLVPVRKVGRLPAETLQEDYALEYGVNTVEIHQDAIKAGDRVIIVDDLLATGGTVAACCKMAEGLGGKVLGISFVIELGFLKGRAKLAGYDVVSLINYD